MLDINKKILEKAKKIKLVLTDVDGVLTDGTLLYGPEGEEIKKFHVRDGLAIRLLEQNAIKVGILTGRDAPGLRARVKDLNIDIAEFGLKDKIPFYTNIINELNLKDEEVAYIGDDIQDLVVLRKVGLSACVNDAPKYLHPEVDLVLDANGGIGAFRELADIILFAQGKLEKIVSS